MKPNAKLFKDFILQLLHRLILLVQPIYTYWIDLFMKLNKTSSAAQTVASIDDLLIEIFVCIPLKPLVRLKLVSKHWNFIISDQNFNFLRSQKNPNPAIGLIFSVFAKWASCPLSYVVSFDKPTNGPLFNTLLEFNSGLPLNSCNGLLLCKRFKDPNERYYVCNPTTNKYFMLPKLDKPANCIDWMSLAFDPSKSPHYKVVCVTDHQNLNQLQVYSSETGCWRKHGEPFSAGVYFRLGVYWNGAIHWISETSTGQSLYFNPDNDQVPQVMPTPPMVTLPNPMGPCWPIIYRHFGESCGHLHYIEDDKRVTELDVYEMRTDYSEWFLKYRVDCSMIENRLALKICALVRGKKDEDSFLVLQLSDERFIRYNLVNKTRETIHEKLDVAERFIRYNLANKTRETIHEKLDVAGARFFRIWEHPLQYIESVSHV